MSVINFGSINVDHVYSVPHLVQAGETLSSTGYQAILGGKGANQSIALAKAGMQTFHVGAIGASDAEFVTQMRQTGVDCSYVRMLSDVASGHAIIQVDEQAENSIVLFGGANQCLSDDHIATVLATAQSGDWVLLQNETNAIETIMLQAKQKGLRVAFNPAPMTDTVRSLPIESLDLLIVNEVEAQQLVDETDLSLLKSALSNAYPQTAVVLTLGKQGACYLYQGHEINVSAFQVEAVDTTAAGDTFIGFLLAALEQQQSIDHALTTACAASAISVTRLGAAPSIPSMDEVQQFLQNHQ